jgi:hypothetical protein
MGSLFKTPKTPDIPAPAKPKVVRMPVQNDPNIQDAANRTKQSALQRRGRLSTILTQNLQGRAGSSGAKLGA